MANSARVSVRERATDKTCACERATDKMSESWPGILTTRWPGAKERLAWLSQSGGSTTRTNLTMADLYGDIPREFPPGSGEIMDSGYRDGGYKPDASEVARACTAPDMPADAALFFALASDGFGRGASDGSFVQLFDGFEVSVRPYAPDAGHAERMRARQPTAATRSQPSKSCATGSARAASSYAATSRALTMASSLLCDQSSLRERLPPRLPPGALSGRR